MADTPELPETDEAFVRRARRAVRQLQDAPAELQRRAVDLFPVRTLPQAAREMLRRVSAVLSFDSWAATPALAVRSGAGLARQLVFDAPEGSVELRVLPTARTLALAGQWLGEETEGRVELEGAAAANAALDETGGFRIEGLAAGEYRLSLQVGDTLIELPPLVLGGPPME